MLFVIVAALLASSANAAGKLTSAQVAKFLDPSSIALDVPKVGALIAIGTTNCALADLDEVAEDKLELICAYRHQPDAKFKVYIETFTVYGRIITAKTLAKEYFKFGAVWCVFKGKEGRMYTCSVNGEYAKLKNALVE